MRNKINFVSKYLITDIQIIIVKTYLRIEILVSCSDNASMN